MHPRRILLGLASTIVTACYGVGPVTPEYDQGRIPTIAIVGGDAQTGLAGQPLAEPLEVLVTDSTGAPYRRLSVRWGVVSGSGGFNGFGCDPARSASTDVSPEGKAAVWFTPSEVGPSTVAAEVPAADGSARQVIFDVESTGRVISFGPGGYDWFLDCDLGPAGFRPRFSSVPTGSTLEFSNSWDSTVLRVTSTSTPPGGAAFDSGPLNPGEWFVFVPEVAGIWEYVDVESGEIGAVTVEPPAG